MDTRAAPLPDAAAELRTIRQLLVALAVVGVLAIAYVAQALLLPVVLGAVIALALRPIVRQAARLGIPEPVSGIVLVLALAAGLTLLVLAIGAQASQFVERAPGLMSEIQFKLRDVFATASAVQEATEQVAEMAEGGGSGPTAVVVERTGLLTQIVGSVAGTGTSLAVALILAAFLLSAGDFYTRWLIEVLPKWSDKRRAMAIVTGIERQVSRYLGTITLINAGLGCAIAIAMWALQMPYWPLWGVAAFLLNFLPYLGAIAGIAMSAGVAIVTYPTLGEAALPPLAYFALTSLEGQVVTPSLVGRSLRINAVSVFLTVLLWVWLWGIPGAFLAVPVLVAVKIVADEVPRLRHLSRILGPVRATTDPDEV